MDKKDKPFKVEKTFGLSVLLKLTKKSVKGVEIKTRGNQLTSNLTRNQVNDAVSKIVDSHNINLRTT